MSELALKFYARGVVMAVMVAAHVSEWHSCLPRAKMVKTMRGQPTVWSQPEGTEEPRTNPIVPKQEESLRPWDWTSGSSTKRTGPWYKMCVYERQKVAKAIKHTHHAQRSEIMALWLQYDSFLMQQSWLREQGLDSPERLIVLTDTNVDNFCKLWENKVARMPMNAQQTATSFSHSSGEPEASCLPILS